MKFSSKTKFLSKIKKFYGQFFIFKIDPTTYIFQMIFRNLLFGIYSPESPRHSVFRFETFFVVVEDLQRNFHCGSTCDLGWKNFRQKFNFSAKVQISSKIEILPKYQNFRQKSKFFPKVEIFVKNRNFAQILKFYNIFKDFRVFTPSKKISKCYFTFC